MYSRGSAHHAFGISEFFWCVLWFSVYMPIQTSLKKKKILSVSNVFGVLVARVSIGAISDTWGLFPDWLISIALWELNDFLLCNLHLWLLCMGLWTTSWKHLSFSSSDSTPCMGISGSFIWAWEKGGEEGGQFSGMTQLLFTWVICIASWIDPALSIMSHVVFHLFHHISLRVDLGMLSFRQARGNLNNFRLGLGGNAARDKHKHTHTHMGAWTHTHTQTCATRPKAATRNLHGAQ